MIAVIARHECCRMLRSVHTWLIMALVAALFGFTFAKQLDLFLSIQAQLAAQDHAVGLTGFMSVRYLEPLALAFTVLAPLLAMRTFSDELRQQTFALWQAAPVSTMQLVLGKFLGVLFIIGLLIALAVSLLLSLAAFAAIDYTLLLSAALGLTLCSAACAACGVFFSSLSRHPLIAIIASLSLLMLSWMTGSANFSAKPMQGLSELSIANHLRGFFQGYLQSGDIVFFLLMTALFLVLSILRLNTLRQTGL